MLLTKHQLVIHFVGTGCLAEEVQKLFHRQILLLPQERQHLKYGRSRIQKNGAAVGNQGGHPLGNAFFEQLVLLQAGIPVLNGGGDAGIFHQAGAAVNLLDEALLLQNIQIPADRFDGNAEGITKLFVQQLLLELFVFS